MGRPMRDQGMEAPRPVWRPKTTAPGASRPELPLRCGGDPPFLSVDERFELMRARKREQDENKAREADEAAAAEKDKKPDDDEDEQRAVERFRNDRYAVKLLRQQDDVWGGGNADPGPLG
jgi:hypothetical protein